MMGLSIVLVGLATGSKLTVSVVVAFCSENG